MRIFIVGLVVFLAWASFARWYYVCKIKKKCTPTEQLDNMDNRGTLGADERPSLALEIDGKKVLEGYEQFTYEQGQVKPNLSNNNEQFIAELAKYLQQNPQTQLTINGAMLQDEVNTNPDSKSMLDKIGLERADHIRQKLFTALKNQGVTVEASSINIDYNEMKNLNTPLIFAGSTMSAEEQAEISHPEEYDTEPKTVQAQFNFNNMTFSDANFEKNKADFNPGKAFKNYADSVKTYFELNPDKRLILIGHTDSDGTDEHNFTLGQARADAVKAYFKNIGVAISSIKTTSRGEKEPTSPNTTEPSKQKIEELIYK